MNKKDLTKMFPWLTSGVLDYELKQVRKRYKTESGFLNHLKLENEKNAEKFGMPDVEKIYIDITWKKSRTWGNCPHAEWECWFKDGSYMHGKTSAGGYGYDKHSTVVANVMNTVAKGMAWRKRKSSKVAPYGLMHVGKNAKKDYPPYFEGGVGISCYPLIVAYLGGKMESHAGKIWDEHIITFK